MTYRNDHDAALARIAALEHELREAHREIARQRGPAPDVEIKMPVVPRAPHFYEDTWTSTSTEADRQLREALSDARAYRREQDANGREEPGTKYAPVRRYPDSHYVQATEVEPVIGAGTMVVAIVASLFFLVAMAVTFSAT
ncbi:MAG TPA: hypothetical protein VGM90_08825 [Kofleriaceae bacterium]|jgi:hypothetical protein